MTDFIQAFWSTLAQMSPYLLFGFFAAGLLSIWVSPALVERHLGGRGFGAVVKASLFGVPLPLCSCGVIPVTMSLYKHGAGRGAAVSFLLSTPQTGIDSIFVTYSLLGPFFAVLRPIAAFLTGLFGGGLVNWLDPSDSGAAEPAKSCTDDCCSKNEKKPPKWERMLRHGFVTLPTDIGLPMLIGLCIAAAISVWVPDDLFAVRLAAGSNLLAMFVMMLVGIPIYVCATASVPIAAALIAKGLSPGAALVFLMTGPATNAAGLSTLWGVLGPRSALLFLFSTAFCALASGLIVDAFLPRQKAVEMMHHHSIALPDWVGHLSALILLTLLLFGIARKCARKAE
ncbi:MAG TPA: SO_0444 family Cu/Zn efflux transporter [Anaerohalosphaeraceae bacterium]|nr:SO_0444 family Cu/Zn efflux transporter [Anaerohalosphaeraceae bacterium]